MISTLLRNRMKSFEAIIYPKDGGGIDYLDLIFICRPKAGCSINTFAVRSDGSGVGTDAAEMPSLLGSILASSALSGYYAEVIERRDYEAIQRVKELANRFGSLSDPKLWELDTGKFMARLISSAKAIGTEGCSPTSDSALNLFLRSLMVSACLAHSWRMSSVLADELRGGPAGNTIPTMMLTSRISGKDSSITLFLELSGEEAGIAAEVKKNNNVEILEGFDAVNSFIRILKEEGTAIPSYCTVVYGYTGMGQY